MGTVVLYGRPGCHLCEQARLTLEGLASGRFLVIERDITGDATLEEAYRWAIPVVTVDGAEFARAPIREARLAAALDERFGPAQR
jgi:hypothetical protein